VPRETDKGDEEKRGKAQETGERRRRNRKRKGDHWERRQFNLGRRKGGKMIHPQKKTQRKGGGENRKIKTAINWGETSTSR